MMHIQKEIMETKQLQLTEVVPDIFRLTVPFMDVYTTVFFVKLPEGVVLFDTATYSEDVEQYILPAMSELGIEEEMLKYVFVSHHHGDHAGGLERLMNRLPDACIVAGSRVLEEKYQHYASLIPKEGDTLLDELQIVMIPGHTDQAMALLDTRTGTLLTGDCLQLYGLYGSGEWGANISYPKEHLAAIEKLHSLPINTIIASHEYHTLGYLAKGKEEIHRYLDECAEALMKMKAFLLEHPQMSDHEIAVLYNETFHLPVIGAHVMGAVRSLL